MLYENGLLSALYAAAPTALQDAFASGYGATKLVERLAPSYRSLLRGLERTQWLTPSEIRELQRRRLCALIEHAYANVPYYRRVFDERGLHPADIRDMCDLSKLPVLTKSAVRRHFQDLQARNVAERATVLGRTGGTTGVPLKFRLDRSQVAFDHALIQRHWSWAGWRPRDLTVLLRGFTLIPASNDRPPFWRRDLLDNRVYLSGFHLAPRHLPLYLDQIRRWGPCYLAGYPSNLFVLARFMNRSGTVIPMKAIFTSSELVTPAERRAIEAAFACRVWDRYGTNERLVVSQQCEEGSYHQNAEFGIAEVEVDGRPSRVGESGRLLQTGLANRAMPLIRFDIGDIAALSEERCACGRGLPLLNPVEGRREDVLVTAEGRPMPRAGLDQIYEYVDRVEQCQLVQERAGEVIVRVVPRPGFSADDERTLVRELRKRVGEATRVTVERVEALPRSPTGKMRFIVSTLDQASPPTSEPMRGPDRDAPSGHQG